MELDAETVARLMAYPRDCYGFAPEDVAEIHVHKVGAGNGLWYRLKDGRVISVYAKPSEGGRALYDTI